MIGVKEGVTCSCVSNLDPVISIWARDWNPGIHLEHWLVVSTFQKVHHLGLFWNPCSLTCAPISSLWETPALSLIDLDMRSSVDKLMVDLVVFLDDSDSSLFILIITGATFTLRYDRTHNSHKDTEEAKPDDGSNDPTASASHGATGSSVEAHVSLPVVVVRVVRKVVGLTIVWHVVPVAKAIHAS